jgi:hypothetical protein
MLLRASLLPASRTVGSRTLNPQAAAGLQRFARFVFAGRGRHR